VALSRARSKQGLQIEGYSPEVIHANTTALQFLSGSGSGGNSEGGGRTSSWKEQARASWVALKEEAAHLAATAPKCPGHNKPCSRLQVRKAGPNKGRFFFACSTRPQCDMFAWDEGDAGGGSGGSGGSNGSSSSSYGSSRGGGGGSSYSGASKTSSYGGGGASSSGRGGDWECGGCGANVFSYKTECFKCGAGKPTGNNRGGNSGRKQSGSNSSSGRGGDWECGGCGANVFSYRTDCFKCGAGKPAGNSHGGAGKGRNRKKGGRASTGY
jgi:hypothetical protein